MRRLRTALPFLFTLVLPVSVSANCGSATQNLAIAVTPSGGSSGLYSQWPDFPKGANFFPIIINQQNPSLTGHNIAPYPNIAASAAAAHFTILVQVDNGGGSNWPTASCTDTNNDFSDLRTNGIYVMPLANRANNTSANSISSLLCLSGNQTNGPAYLIGYNLGDEGDCLTSSGLTSSLIKTMSSWDSPQGSRPFICNQTDWAFGHGTTDPAAEQATSIASFDLYPITSPWNANSNIPIISGQPQDSLWIQGYSVVVFRQKGRPDQPVWSYLDTGTDELGYSSQNGSTCNYSTNLCTPNNHEARATNEHVNAEAWNGLINGAVGVEWFCQDSTSYSFCLGDPTSSASSVAASVFANLTYVNGTILSYAQQLNSPTAGICTMITGTQYSNYTSTCSNGILSVSTGTASVPANALVKNYNGVHYLVAAPAHNGQTNLTFTLTGDVGKTATVVYDSNDHYDPAHSSVGQTFTLDGSGQFTDTFGANDHNYQPKVYRMQ